MLLSLSMYYKYMSLTNIKMNIIDVFEVDIYMYLQLYFFQINFNLISVYLKYMNL